jgi:3-deoxy-7-phosphoheptulonate synthase
MKTMVTKPVTVHFQTNTGERAIHFGGSKFQVIAGPCSIESREHLLETGKGVKAGGACLLRGGIFKMRTNPSSFQGIGSSAFTFLNEIKRELGMPLVSEVTDPRQINDLINVVDMFQIGSRNMYNYELLKELGHTGKAVLLKRAFAATIEEWMKAADYVANTSGEAKVVLCERGIRTFEPTTRNTLDLNSVAYLKAHSAFPVIVDPSHGTGRPELILPMSLAAAGVGADGVIIEVHPRPREALSDAFQAIDIAHFASIMDSLEKVTKALGRELEKPL